jgi:hypothetical protein
MAMDGMNGYSLSDIKAVTDGDNHDGFGDGNGIWIVLLLFLFWGFNGNGGFGGRNYGYGDAPATQGQMTDQFNFEALRQGQADGVSAVKEAQYENGTLIKDVAYNNLNQIRDIEAMVAQNGYQQAQCCCDIQKELLMSRANDDKNTCAIVNAIHTDGEATRNMITQNVIQSLRDQVQDGKIYASNCAQTSEILNTIGRYVTNPPCPIQTVPYNYGCGCGCNSCGC